MRENDRLCRVFRLQCHPRTVLGLLFLFLGFFYLLTSLIGDVTVANFNTLKDRFGNLGAWYVLSFLYRHVILTIFSLVQDVAQMMNEVVGDGTTPATVLACSIYSEGVGNVAAGCNPWIFAEVPQPPSTMSLNSSLPTPKSLPPPKSSRSPPSPLTVTSTLATSSHRLW